MLKWDIIRILFLLFVIVACHVDNRQCSELLRADSLLMHSADSALLLLDNIDLNEVNSPADKATYALLLTQARDKNYIVHTDDSLISIAVHYFDSIGDVHLSGKSHYYLGRTYQDLEDYVTATREFLIAINLAKRIGDYHLISLACGNLGYTYYQQSLYEKADSLYCKAQEIAVQAGDSSNLVMTLVARANICMARGKCDKEAVEYLEYASFISGFLKKRSIESVVFNALGALYESIDSLSLASDYIRRGILLKEEKKNLAGYYLLQGSVFYRAEEYDSAMIYLTKSLFTDSYYTKAGAYLRLSEVNKKRGLFKESLRYNDYYLSYLDSIKKLEGSAVKILSMENRVQMQTYAKYYSSFLNKYKTYIYLLLGLSFFCVLALIYRHRAYFRKLQNVIGEKSHLELRLKKMEVLQEELRWKESQIIELQEKNDNQIENKQKIFFLSEQCAFLNKQKEILFMSLLLDSENYKSLLILIEEKRKDCKCKKQFTDKDWELLLIDINRFSNGFIDRLKNQYELLNAKDIRFCCLVRIRLNYTDMSFVFDRSLDAMYKKRNNIVENKMLLNPKLCSLETILDTF